MEKKIQVKKQKKSRETFWNKFRRNPLFYLFLLFFLIKGSYETYNNYRLERDGYILRLLYIKTARDVICTINFRLMALPTMVKNGQVKPLETPCQ